MNRILAQLANGKRITQAWTALPEKRTHRTQAVIVGGGTAGAVAAVAAAKLNLASILIEPHTFLGGVGTGGGINSYYHGAKGGVQDEIDTKTHTLDVAISVSTRGFHPDAKKAELDRALQNSSVTVRYRTRLTGVLMEGARVVGVRVAAAGLEEDIFAPVAIDCSGDADVAALAGCAFRMGRPLDGMPQPYSAPSGYLYEGKSISGRNFDAGYVIPTDGADLSRALIAGHRQHLIGEYTAQNRMTYLAPHLGLREGRFIIGEATVTLRNLIDTQRFEDVVFETRAHYDNHAKDWAFESAEAREWVTVCGFWSCPLKCDVPYGSLVPQKVDGLLVACRGISITHDSAQSFRMQRDMQKLGEVAATAAQLAVQNGVTPRSIPIHELQKRLHATGCLETLPAAGHGLRKDTPYDQTPESIGKHLSSTHPGPGIWCAAKICNDSIVPQLVAWLKDSDKQRAASAALALGLRGCTEALPALCAMVDTRDGFTPTGGHYGQPRWHAALFLLEKLHAVESLGTLSRLVEDRTADPKALGYAVRALAAVGDAHPAVRPQAGEPLKALAQAGEFAPRVGLHGFAPMLELQVSTAGKSNQESMRALFDLTIADALMRWDDQAGHTILARYETQGNAREQQFVAQIQARQELVAVGA